DNPVVLTARIDTRADGKKEYVLTMKIHPGYHTYARLDPADPYILTTIEMEYPAGVEADGDMIMPPFQPTSNATSYYVDTVEFRQPLKGNGKGEIGAKIRYQACDHSECKLPVTTTVKVTL
ncbi:protein-disulfide reductase DsbD domain-containing protein, partial [Parabacteroides johnsonii]